jgi:chaperonin GroES
MKLIPLGDKVVLKQMEAEETTASGIILSAKTQEKPLEAIVVAVGPGGVVDGKEVTMQVKEGDKVIYQKYATTEVKVGGEEYLVVKQNDILAIVVE